MFAVDMDTRELSRRMRAISEKQLAYAAVNAVNRAAKDVQAEIRTRVTAEFVLRRPDFVLRQAAIIKPFASVRYVRPYAEIAVGEKQRFLLSRYEAGGERPVTSGASQAAAPVVKSPARPSFASRITQGLTYKALRLRKRQDGRRRGAKRTFVIPGVGVYQRTGAKSRDITLLYAFTIGQRLDQRLRFVSTAQTVGERAMTRYLAEEVAAAVAYARRRGR